VRTGGPVSAVKGGGAGHGVEGEVGEVGQEERARESINF